MTDLKSCPFCGSPAKIASERDGEYICCTTCSTRLSIGDRARGIAAWNRRPASMAREEALPNKGRATEVTIVQPRTGTVIRREIWEMITHEGRRYLCVPDRFVQPADQTLQIEGRSLKSEGTPPKEEGVDLGCDDAEFGMSEHRTPPKDRGEE